MLLNLFLKVSCKNVKFFKVSFSNIWYAFFLKFLENTFTNWHVTSSSITHILMCIKKGEYKNLKILSYSGEEYKSLELLSYLRENIRVTQGGTFKTF